MTKRGKIISILYFFFLFFIIAFGIIYFMPFGGGAEVMIFILCIIYTMTFCGALFGRTMTHKIGLTLLFGFIFFLVFWVTLDSFTFRSQKIDLLLEQLEDPDDSARSRAARQLAEESTGFTLPESTQIEVVEALIKALKDPAYHVKASAAYALGEIGDVRAVDPLIAALLEDGLVPHSDILRALGKIGDERAIPPIVTLLMEETSEYSLEKYAAALEELGWEPESDEEKVRFFIGKRDRDELILLWNETKQVLLNDLDSMDRLRMEYALCTFISIGNEEIIPVLIDKLDTIGNKDMAEIYLNCGNEQLENVAKLWAEENGYEIVTRPGGGETTWGSW